MLPGKDGDKYISYDKRAGNESIVYFTRDLSAKGLEKIYKKINQNLTGKIAVKLHTGEPHGPNIIPRDWVKNLIQNEIPKAKIVETNSYYDGDRYTTEQHRKTLKINGWDFAFVDIMDELGTALLPVKGGNWFKNLTHFKGHAMGGFGGSNKNIGIGCADGRIGKAMIHTTPGQPEQWDISKEEFMERMTESTKATIDYFGKNIAYINVMRNMSVSCDCEGVAAEPVVTPNVGIVASLDILAVDQASVDLVYSMPNNLNAAFIERIETRHGLRQLSYMKELKMGNDKYILIDIDNNDSKISISDAVKDVKPFEG